MNGIYTDDVNLLRKHNNTTVQKNNLTMTHVRATIVAVENQ
jgi:hypothetical protein